MNAKRAKKLRRAAEAGAVTDAPASVQAKDGQRALHPGSRRGLYRLMKQAARRAKT